MYILLVDDKPERRKEIGELLRSQGHNVRVAKDGIGALAIMKRSKFNIVVTDTNMPCMNGPELVAELKLRYRNLPIIGISVHPKNKKHYENFWCKSDPPQKLFKLIEKLISARLK